MQVHLNGASPSTDHAISPRPPQTRNDSSSSTSTSSVVRAGSYLPAPPTDRPATGSCKNVSLHGGRVSRRPSHFDTSTSTMTSAPAAPAATVVNQHAAPAVAIAVIPPQPPTARAASDAGNSSSSSSSAALAHLTVETNNTSITLRRPSNHQVNVAISPTAAEVRPLRIHRPRNILQEVKQLYQHGRYREAISTITKALKSIDPNNSSEDRDLCIHLLKWRSESYKKIGKFSLTAQDLLTNYNLNPYDFDNLARYAMLYFERGKSALNKNTAVSLPKAIERLEYAIHIVTETAVLEERTDELNILKSRIKSYLDRAKQQHALITSVS